MIRKSILFFCLLITTLIFSNSLAQSPPSGFASVTISNQWNEAVGLTFSEDGTEMFVWERGGRAWVVKNNQKQLLIDISEEVLGFYDHGMLGFALHPQFNQNGYFYLFYLVDRHHLINYGTAAYNPSSNEYAGASIGRLTRYTAVKTTSGYTVDPGSRKVLIGATKSTGIPSTNDSHVVGSILFGTDGTLLVGTGDGAGPYYDLGNGWANGYYAQALADGIITPAENVGVFRSQLLDCHSGKLLRIDPETGEGVPSNPFYDPARPSAAISKVYALGIRQPFKMTLKPGTGSHNPADGNPGTIYMGDVGYDTWEEINVIDKPGLNLGWPIFEGLEPSPMATMFVDNVMAPNPLYPATGCRQFFRFQELLKQATASGVVTFPNPCNPGQSIPSSIKTFIHHRPIIDFRHDVAGTRTGIFNGETAGVVNIGDAGSPVAGTPFVGSAAVGGVFYPHSDFPPEYQNEYFFGDYSYGWIRNLDMDPTDKPVQVRNFVNSGAVVVGMAVHPAEGGLYYINFPSEIRKVIYSNNQPPVAAASVNTTFGASPLVAQLSSNGSSDPEGHTLTYEWNFGDGSPLSNEANPTHTFIAPSGSPVQYLITLKVTDNLGVSDEAMLSISLNNTPPEVTIDSPEDGTLYPMDQETTYLMQATVDDAEHSIDQLTFEWQTFLHHNNHSHPNPKVNAPTSSLTVDPLGCDGQTYSYRVVLKVTDPVGGTTIREVKLYPDCGSIPVVTPVITWSPPPTLPVGTALSASVLNATATHNGIAVPGTFSYAPPLGTVLPLGDNQELAVTFTPGDTSRYHPVSKTVTVNVVQLLVPVITWPTPAAILAGTALSTTQLNAAASYNGSPVEGTFVYAPAAGTVLGVGNGQQLSVTFTPTNASVYASATATVLINVNAAPVRILYRALNLNGAALSIDGNTFQASAGAPNFSYTTNGTTFANQAVPLIPATDANRATMIRSSIYGGVVNLTISAVPAGTYEISIYVWEDNIPQTYSLSLEGNLAQANINSGNAGVWMKLGPFTRTINDGAINIATNGGHANLSGVEIWTIGGNNLPPVIANAIPDQTATQGAAFTYSFPANTFTDPNAGTVLTYSASLSNGSPLPAWLSFNASTRTFSGTPNVVGPIDVRVTASDGAGGSVNDMFLLTVNPAVPVINWATPSPIPVGTALGAIQLNASAIYNGTPVAGTFVYTPPSGTILSQGNGQLLSVVFTPSNNVLFTTANKSVLIDVVPPVTPVITWPTPSSITVGTALGGTQLNATASYNGSPVPGTFVYTPPTGTVLALGNAQQLSVTFTPTNSLQYTAASKTVLIDVTLATPVISWSPPTTLPVGTVLNGTHLNAAAIHNGSPVPGTFAYTPPLGTALALGNGQQLSVTFTPDNPSLYSQASKTVIIDVISLSTPVIAWSPPATITVGTALGATHLNATASHNGSPVPGTFVYTPPSGTVLPLGNGQQLSVTFTPTNTSLYDPASRTVTIDVVEVPVMTPVITWATPAAITAGTALSATQLNATASYNGTPVAGTFVYTPGLGTVLGIGDAQLLSVSFTPTNPLLYTSANASVLINVVAAPSQVFFRALNLNGASLTIDGNLFQASVGAPNFSYTTNGTTFANQAVPLVPATDANRATMIRSSIYGGSVSLAIGAIPSGTYQVWLYVWEDNLAQTYSISLEGAVVQSNHNSGNAGVWRKLGPYTRAITDGTINIAANGGHANLSGVEIWSVIAGGNNQPPVVANAIPDQTATLGTAFSYAFPSNTFTDPNAGTMLTYSASLSNDSPLPAWLIFNPSTRTFSGTPNAVGPVNVRVTASDGAGGSVNDTFILTVNQAVPLINWATPSPIPVGTALGATQLNATATHNGSAVAGTFVYTPSSGTVLSLGNGQQLSVAFTPSNGTLYTTASRTVTINVVPVSLVTPVVTWPPPASITVGTALGATQLNATASYNGSPVAGTFAYTPPSGTILGLGNGQQLSVTFTPTNPLVYTSANASVFINVVSAPARVFYRALNLNGAALTIDGNTFQASAGAANFSYTTNGTTFANQAVPLIPATDANRATMIRSSIYGGIVNLTISAVPAGTYEVSVYVWEDNIPQTYTLSLEGSIAQANINSGNAGVWMKLGPYTRTVNDGAINIGTNGGHANLSGVEIWRVNQPSGARMAEEVLPDKPDEEGSWGGLKLTAYPNPSSGKVNISFSVNEPTPTQLAMYDLRGIRIQVLYEGSIQPGKNEEIEIETELPDGVYVLQLVNGRHVKHLKLAMAR